MNITEQGSKVEMHACRGQAKTVSWLGVFMNYSREKLLVFVQRATGMSVQWTQLSHSYVLLASST